MSSQYERDTDARMNKTIESLQKDLAKIRTGRASPALVESVRVECYGTQTPLNQVAAIAVPDPKMITVSPWDKNLIGAVEKAIQSANLGLNPVRDKNLVRLPIPPLTEERRREMAKQCSQIGEEAKVSLRNIRRDTNEAVKKAEKDKQLSEDESRREQDSVQKATDRFVTQIGEAVKAKEADIMSV